MSGIASVPIEHVVHDNIQNFKLVNQLRKRWNSIDLATRVPDSESEEAHQILFEHPFLTEEEVCYNS
jgi:phage pi2 protein 07